MLPDLVNPMVKEMIALGHLANMDNLQPKKILSSAFTNLRLEDFDSNW